MWRPRQPGLGRWLVRVDRGDVDLVDAEGVLDDLPRQSGKALAGFHGSADDRRHAVVDLHRRRRHLVGAFRAEHVHHADAVADAAAHRTRFARAFGAAGQQPLVLGGVPGKLRQREVPYRAQQFGDRRRARHRLPGREHVARRQGVAQTQLRRVDAEFLRQLVHLRLVRGADLEGAFSAYVAGGRVVGAYRPALDEGVRDDVRAAGEGDGGGERLGGRVGVRARVEEDLRLDLDQLALGVRVVAVAQEGGVAVGVAEEGLLARSGELDRAAGPQREQAERELEALVLAVTGRPGHARDHDLHALGFEAVAGGGEVAVAVRVGGGDVELHSPVGPRDGEAGLGTDGGRVLAADAVLALDNDFADRVLVAVAQRDVADQVAVGVQGLGGEGLLGVGDRFEHVVLDDDGRRGHARGVRVVGGDGRDGLAVVAYDVGGEHRAVRGTVAGEGSSGDVLVRDDGAHAGHLARVGGVDGEDARVRVRGAQDGRPQQALGPQVGGVREGALRLGARLGGRQGGPETVRQWLGHGGRGRGGCCFVTHARPPS